jgi:hypothetical protein
MGRYAFFNTGFEYKFAFGIQSTYDIELFGGTDTTEVDENDEIIKASREWHADEKEKVLELLKEISEETSFSVPNFNEIEKTVHGTYLIDEYIIKNRYIGENIGERYYTFLLGCIIYHQLLYIDHLTVEYEL